MEDELITITCDGEEVNGMSELGIKAEDFIKITHPFIDWFCPTFGGFFILAYLLVSIFPSQGLEILSNPFLFSGGLIIWGIIVWIILRYIEYRTYNKKEKKQ